MQTLYDPRTEFGSRIEKRLQIEWIAWLTTVSPEGEPNPRPVWFVWDGESFLIYSRPGTHKLNHIHTNPKVSINLDGDGLGGNIIVFLGEAQILEDFPPANLNAVYINKYAAGMERIGMNAEQFARTYSVTIRVRPVRLRGH